MIYNENSYVVLSSIKSEPSNIYFENEVYNIVYSCGLSCVKYVFFKKPNTVSDVYLNSLAISDKGEFVLTMYGNLVQVYETFTHKKIYKKKLDNGGDILSNGSFNDAGYEGGKFFIRHRTIGGNYSEEKISIK
ncbi:hypothetical protein [Tolumonas lignilytica]|uniref:hypothetical protein n=1 Tax=Tolumonas lignilytica TaxID=1283284 RepID=UPI0012689FA0|nr:hypothetical protein [Tolumonas lignilytica]